MIRQCLGRVPKEELTFGDGRTKFYTEGVCGANFVCSADVIPLCDTCRGGANGTIMDLYPPDSQIFSPSTWFMNTLKTAGMPNRNALNKAINAYNKVVVMGRPKKKTVSKGDATNDVSTVNTVPTTILYYETDEIVQPTEVISNKLLTVKVKNKLLYKDLNTGLLFTRTKGGRYVPQITTSKTQESVPQES